MSFDDAIILLNCPKCGHELTTTIGQLKITPDIECGGCGAIITAVGDALDVEEAVRKAGLDAGFDLE